MEKVNHVIESSAAAAFLITYASTTVTLKLLQWTAKGPRLFLRYVCAEQTGSSCCSAVDQVRLVFNRHDFLNLPFSNIGKQQKDGRCQFRRRLRITSILSVLNMQTV